MQLASSEVITRMQVKIYQEQKHKSFTIKQEMQFYGVKIRKEGTLNIVLDCWLNYGSLKVHPLSKKWPPSEKKK